jgi:subtilisin family serine protease
MTIRCVFSLLKYDHPAYVPQVRNAITAGVPIVVSAGNGHDENGDEDDGEPAVNKSPARVDEAITVGATTINDAFVFFSNFGSKVDILAPGDEILCAGHVEDNEVTTQSGTSHAA